MSWYCCGATAHLPKVVLCSTLDFSLAAHFTSAWLHIAIVPVSACNAGERQSLRDMLRPRYTDHLLRAVCGLAGMQTAVPRAAVRPLPVVSRCSAPGGTADHSWVAPSQRCWQKAIWGPGGKRLHASHSCSRLLQRASGGARAGGAGDAATEAPVSPARAPGPVQEVVSAAAGSAQAAGSSEAAGNGQPLQGAQSAVLALGAGAAAGSDGAAAAGASSAPAPGSSAGSAEVAAAVEAPAGVAPLAGAAAVAEGAAPGAAPGPFGAALRPDSLEAAAVELAGILGNAAWWYLQWHVEDLPHVLRRRRLRALRKVADTDPADPARCALLAARGRPVRVANPGSARRKGLNEMPEVVRCASIPWARC